MRNETHTGTPPWVIVAGGFHREGAMDQLNAALARYLIGQGTPVHLVGHRFDDEFIEHPAARLHRVAKPAGSFFLGQRQLDRAGRAVAARVTARCPAARVLVNGVNCAWPDLNWIHFVHQALPPRVGGGGPRWLRLKNRLETELQARRERTLLGGARRLFVNSERTRADLIETLGLSNERMTTVYPASDMAVGPPSAADRASARAWLGFATEPVVAFVGTLRHDHHKGFDTLWRAWRELCARPDWSASLVVAGGGRMLENWRRSVAAAGLEGRVRMLGHTERIDEVLAAADLLVSPTRYEAYGLNVHEAIALGVPAMVTARAGVAERYPAALRDMLLPAPEDSADLSARLLAWSLNPSRARQRFEAFGAQLRACTTTAMARQIVEFSASETVEKKCAN
ncbi:MAG TPA: glycosyltransferase family 4 protein [Candidatus Binataceae bacterium]|nr:glycosyltransferase family 4 protein [Candidatus Binataceae bacterium]